MADTELKKAQPDWQVWMNQLKNLFDNHVNTVGKIDHFDNPLTWINGATGTSNATTITFGDLKVVILSVGSVTTKGLNDFTNVAKIPKGIRPQNSTTIRLSLTEKVMLGAVGSDTLTLWNTSTDTDANQRWGACFYLADTNQ